jgi:hypothetical protein
MLQSGFVAAQQKRVDFGGEYVDKPAIRCGRTRRFLSAAIAGSQL